MPRYTFFSPFKIRSQLAGGVGHIGKINSLASIFLALIVLTSLASASVCLAKELPMMTPEELATQKFRVSVEGVAFDVPANYHYSEYEMFRAWPRPPKEQVEGKERAKVDVIRIMALLPNVAPYTEENATDFSAPGWGKKVVGYMTRRRINWSYWFTNTFPKLSKVTDTSNVPDMTHYRDPLLHSDIYLSNTQPTDSISRINCHDPRNKPSPSCTLDTIYLERYDLQIKFSRSYLDQWRDIDRKMKVLLDSFRQSGSSKSTS